MAAFSSALQAPQTRSRDTLAKAEQLDCLFRQLRPRLLIFDEFHNCLRGRSRDVEAIFAVLRRLGRDYDISPAPGESEVTTQVERLSSKDTKIAPRLIRMAAGDSGKADAFGILPS